MNPESPAQVIPAEIYERVASAYASAHQFNVTTRDYSGNRISGYEVERTYDLGREPIEIVFLRENEYLVIDQPRNFKDYFAQGGSGAWGRDGAATAIKMRNFYSSHHLRVLDDGKLSLETQTWSGGRFSKDAEKSQKQLAKYIKTHLSRASALPHLDSIIVT